ncbi:MAG: RNA-binding S4 domain-containing protein [Oscillospiraceae bacterium]|nr:RNA-binding S4 domain-containing protein [Oscillospiraceae bacterium]
MRLDKFLKVSRIIKRRTLANEACDAGKVRVNGKPVKAGFQVKPGDVVELMLAQRTVKVEVLSLDENPGKADAAAMYRALQTEGD